MKVKNLRKKIIYTVFFSFLILLSASLLQSCGSGGGGGGSNGGSPGITLSSSSATPTTVLAIQTTGIAGISSDTSTTSTSVRFSNTAGYTVTVPATRVQSDGTVIVGVPLYIDPSTHMITMGTVDVSVNQATSSGSVTTSSASLTILDLPQTGLAVGTVTHQFLTFSALMMGSRIASLQYFENALEDTTGASKIDPTAALSDESNLLVATINERSEIDSALQSPVIIGTLPNGTQIQLDSTSVDVMDRLIAVWLTQLAVSQNSTILSSANITPWQVSRVTSLSSFFGLVPPVYADSGSGFGSTLTTLLQKLTSVFDAGSAADGLFSNNQDATDNVVSTANATSATLDVFGQENASTSTGLLGADLAVKNAARHVVNDISSTISNVIKCVASDSVCQQNVENDVENLPQKSAATLLSGYAQTTASIGAFTGSITAGGGLLLNWASKILDQISNSSSPDNTINNDIAANGSSVRTGGIWLQGSVNSNTSSGADLLEAASDPYPNAVRPSTSVTDAQGNYNLPIPVDPNGNYPSTLTVTATDPVTAKVGGSLTVSIPAGGTPGQAVTAPSIAYNPTNLSCSDPDINTDPFDDPDCD